MPLNNVETAIAAEKQAVAKSTESDASGASMAPETTASAQGTSLPNSVTSAETVASSRRYGNSW